MNVSYESSNQSLYQLRQWWIWIFHRYKYFTYINMNPRLALIKNKDLVFNFIKRPIVIGRKWFKKIVRKYPYSFTKIYIFYHTSLVMKRLNLKDLQNWKIIASNIINLNSNLFNDQKCNINQRKNPSISYAIFFFTYNDQSWGFPFMQNYNYFLSKSAKLKHNCKSDSYIALFQW